jgi:hypothetical protein
MTSEKQLAANRRNAQGSTGPKTDEGKAITRLNAAKHGGLAATPVVPRLERPEEWAEHLAATMASLNPVGHLEAVLAQRIALLFWRLGRVARYERETIAIGQEAVEDELAEQRRLPLSRGIGGDFLSEVKSELESARESAELFERFAALADEVPLSGDDAATILSAVADQTENADPGDFSMPKVVPDEIPWDEFTEWTAGRVRRGIAAMASEEGVGAERLWEQTLVQAYAQVIRLKQEVAKVTGQLDRMRRERLLPQGPDLDKLTRYEAHLSRQLAQALHELQRLQAARSGEPVTPPAVLDVTVSGSE